MQNTLLDSYRIAQNFGDKKLLAVHCQSAKVLSAKKLLGLVSSNIKWALPVPTAKVFSHQSFVLYGICLFLHYYLD